MAKRPTQSRAEVRNTKLRKVAADLFLKYGYEGVSLDRIVDLAGGSKSTIYSEFGGKCGLFISSIEKLCRDSNEALAAIDYDGMSLEQSLKKLSFCILKLITTQRSVDLHRLAIGEAANCPEVGEAWYTHGPARTAAFIRSVLEEHRAELLDGRVTTEQVAVLLHGALTGDVLYRHLSGVTLKESEGALQQQADRIVDVVLANVRPRPDGTRKKNHRAR